MCSEQWLSIKDLQETPDQLKSVVVKGPTGNKEIWRCQPLLWIWPLASPLLPFCDIKDTWNWGTHKTDLRNFWELLSSQLRPWVDNFLINKPFLISNSDLLNIGLLKSWARKQWIGYTFYVPYFSVDREKLEREWEEKYGKEKMESTWELERRDGQYFQLDKESRRVKQFCASVSFLFPQSWHYLDFCL